MGKDLRANGHINIPNVGSQSECIGLTYTIRGLNSLKQLVQIGKDLDAITKEESIVNAEIARMGSDTEEIIGKYKIRACGSDKKARAIKIECDKLLKTLGGQTTLDPPEDDNEEDES